jgi:hypothetical protein
VSPKLVCGLGRLGNGGKLGFGGNITPDRFLKPVRCGKIDVL